jgi:hypothetical protein
METIELTKPIRKPRNKQTKTTEVIQPEKNIEPIVEANVSIETINTSVPSISQPNTTDTIDVPQPKRQPRKRVVKQTKVEAIVEPIVLKQQEQVTNPKKQELEEKVIQRRIDELEKAITNKKIKRTEKANNQLEQKLNALEKQLAELQSSSEEDEEPIKQRIIKTKPIKIPTIPSNKPTYLTRADVIKSFGF